MPRFLCLQRTLAEPSPTPSSGTTASPSRQDDWHAQFRNWQAQFQAQIVDPGGRLGSGTLVHDQDPGDGPFVKVHELIGGYMILEAAELEEAVSIARACPGVVRPGSGVEVVEIPTA